jgi:hypothetical protein
MLGEGLVKAGKKGNGSAEERKGGKGRTTY